MTEMTLRAHHIMSSCSDATICLDYKDGFEQWRFRDSKISFWRTGRIWLTLGGPQGPSDQRQDACRQFIAEAKKLRCKVCFCATETLDWLPSDYANISIGQMPIWRPIDWQQFLKSKSSMREQLRRSRAKQVTVEIVENSLETRKSFDLHIRLEDIEKSWYRTRPLPPLGYALGRKPHMISGGERLIIARQSQAIIAFMRVHPIYDGKGWFVENIYQSAHVPNGTVALMTDHLMLVAQKTGVELVTFGMVPLLDRELMILKMCYRIFRCAYNFDGLYAFRSKFGPSAWVPVYLAYPKRVGQFRALWAIGMALCANKKWEFFKRFFWLRFTKFS